MHASSLLPPSLPPSLPPWLPAEARLLAHHLASRLGVRVAIVDINDRGESVRGCSPAASLLAALSDNALGHGGQSTPAVLLTGALR